MCKVRQSCLSSLATLSRVSSFLPFETKKRLYNALVLPHMDYCCVVWMECGATLRHEMEWLQNYGMRLITSSSRLACSAMLRSRLGWVPLEQRRRLFRLALVHKCLLGRAPQYPCSKFVTNESLGLRTTRGSSNLHLKRPITKFYHNSFEYQDAFDWNHLPNNIKTIHSEPVFKCFVQNIFLLSC